MRDIDYNIKNQLLLWGLTGIIIASGESSDHYFTGNWLIDEYRHHKHEWFRSKSENWEIDNDLRLLPTLPPSLNFEIYDDEKY
jgi:hypothetical protein